MAIIRQAYLNAGMHVVQLFIRAFHIGTVPQTIISSIGLPSHVCRLPKQTGLIVSLT